jgi:two-component system, OmpR family, response regulator
MAAQHSVASLRSGPFGRSESDRHAAGRRARPVLHVVDDDRSTRALLCDVAHDAGWEVREFTRLSEFEAATRHERPDLVILDDDLPDGRGGDRARELRADPRLARVNILVCTAAHPMRRAEINAWAPVISKPFELRQIEAFLDADGRRDNGEARQAG